MKLSLLAAYVSCHPLRDLNLVNVEILERNLTHRFHSSDFQWEIKTGPAKARPHPESKKVNFIKVKVNLNGGEDQEHNHTEDTLTDGDNERITEQVPTPTTSLEDFGHSESYSSWSMALPTTVPSDFEKELRFETTESLITDSTSAYETTGETTVPASSEQIPRQTTGRLS